MVNVTFDSLTSALATEMINDAEAEVNKYLAQRYDISSAVFQTTTSIPPMVRAMSTSLAEGYMWGRMSRGGKESLARANDLVKNVIDNLKAISIYRADLTATNGSLIPESTGVYGRVLANNLNYTNTFDEGSQLDWQVDEDKLTDLSNEKD